MTRRIATTAATMAALLLLPAGASAAESVAVSAGVLTYSSDLGTVDTVTLDDGTGGTHLLSETASPTGTVGAGCAYIGAYVAECTGATSASLQTLDGNDAVTVNAALPASVSGGDGNDVLTGGPTPDTINGGFGDDTIDGRGGQDRISAGDGADTIEARDGAADQIDCGTGTDTVHADAVDVLSNCDLPTAPDEETAPPAGHGEPAPVRGGVETAIHVPLSPPPVAAPVALTQVEARVSRAGVAMLDLACAPTELAGCRGMVYLDPAPANRRRSAVRKARAARRGRFGRGPFVIAAGKEKRIKVKLSRAARRALGVGRREARAARRGRRVEAVVTVVQRGRRPTRSKVTLRSS